MFNINSISSNNSNVNNIINKHKKFVILGIVIFNIAMMQEHCALIFYLIVYEFFIYLCFCILF